MNFIVGVVNVDEGDIPLGGEFIHKASIAAHSKDINHIFQDPRMETVINLTVEENMAITYRRSKKHNFFKKSTTEQEHELFKGASTKFGPGLGSRMKTDATFLPGKQRQALTLAMAALARPKISLLDEHTVALDLKISNMVIHLTKKIVEEQELMTLMIIHNMGHAIERGNHLIILYHGKIVVGVRGDKKKNLTAAQPMDFLHENSGQALDDDAPMLG